MLIFISELLEGYFDQSIRKEIQFDLLDPDMTLAKKMEKFPIHCIRYSNRGYSFLFFFESECRKLTEYPGEVKTWAWFLQSQEQSRSYDASRKQTNKNLSGTHRTAPSVCCLAFLIIDNNTHADSLKEPVTFAQCLAKVLISPRWPPLKDFYFLLHVSCEYIWLTKQK